MIRLSMKRLRMLLNSVNNGVTIVNYRSTKTFQYRHFTMDGKQKDNAGDKPLQEASKGKSDQKSNITSTINYAGDTYGEFERTVMERLNESNSRRFRVILTTTVLVIFWVVIVFGARIRKMLTQHTADLAKETLEDESLKIQTQELARAVVQTVLNDKEIAAQAATFLKDASTAPETQQALLKLTIHVLQHPDSLAELTEMIKKIIDHLSTDKETIKRLADLSVEVLQDPLLKAQLVVLVNELVQDQEIIDTAIRMVLDIAATKDIEKATTDLLSKSSAQVLEDEEVVNKSREFVTDVMGDDLIQKEGGNALMNSITYALKPGIIRVTGISLIFLSVAIAKIALSPY